MGEVVDGLVIRVGMHRGGEPRLIPKLSSNTFATVARQFVVHEALDTSSCRAGSYRCSFTPAPP